MKFDKLTKQSKEHRNSSIELFRIISMICIVAHHYIVNSGIISKITPPQFNSLFALLFGFGGKTGINCFILITGYFMCLSNITLKKFLKLFLEIQFYKITIYLIFLLTGYIPFSFDTMFRSVLPLSLIISSIGTSFTGSYLVFFLFIPYLNLLIQGMNEKQHQKLVILCLLVGSVFQTFFKATPAFTYIGWFMVLYFIASYIRIYPKNIFADKKVWKYGTLIMLLLCFTSIIIGAYIYSKTANPMFYYFVADSNKILAVSTAVCAFLYFKNMTIKYNPIINKVASSTFGVLLIHANSDTMRKWLWQDTLKNTTAFGTNTFIFHAIISVTVVYTVCTFIDMLRIKFIEKPFFKYLDSRN